MSDEFNLSKIQEPITSASLPVRQILEKVLELERKKLYQKNLRNINDDIVKIIKESVNETNFPQA